MEELKLKVLVIDDDPGDVEILRRLLDEITGWSVELVASGDSSGLCELAQNDVDVVFVDYMLGRDTGLTVLRAIREWYPDSPVILLTGRGDERIAVEAMHAGACDYLPKGSLSAQSLRRSIESAVERAQMRRLLAQHRQSLEAANRDLERRNDEIRSFYHTLSHELKTPLTSTMEFISLVMDGAAGSIEEEQRECLEIARDGCRQMLVSINDLLDASRIESGKLTLDRRPCDVGELIGRVCTALRRRAEAHELKLTCELQPGMPSGLVDPVRFSQILTNLVNNALKFTPAGGEISVFCLRDERDPGLLRIDVCDSGVGIAAEHLERIFDRLYQVRDSDTAVGGLGIGLNLCRELVQLHGGSIRVESEPGNGSTFSFTVQAVDQHQSVPTPSEVSVP